MISKSLGGLFAASLLVFGAGCESNSGHAEGAHTMPDGTKMSGTSHMLMCPKCETVWSAKSSGHGKSERMVGKNTMVCPTCETMASSYAKDGDKVLHECPDCKVTPVVLMPAPDATMRRKG